MLSRRPLARSLGAIWAGVSIVWCLVGCADPSPGASSTDHSSSALFRADVELVRPAARADFTVGDDPASQLHLLRGAVFVDSSVAVANSGFDEVMLFTPDGSLAWTQGREGPGPGEYRYITGLFLDGDRLVVWDNGTQRATLVDLSGEFISTTNFRVPGLRALQMVGVANGVALMEYRETGFPGAGSAPTQRVREDVVYAFVALDDGEVLDTLSRPGRDRWVRREGGRGPHGGLEVPFAAEGLSTVTSEGVYWGDTKSRYVGRLYPDSTARRSVFVRATHAVPEGWEETVRDTLRRSVLSMPERLGSESPFVREMVQFRLELLETLPVGSTVPFFSDLVGGADGLLWFREYPAPGADSVMWVGVDAEMQPIRRMRVPAGITVQDISWNSILTSEVLPSGEYRVQVFSLTPP